MFPLHLDAGACPRGQVGVWHSDAVMQPGPRDGRGSTNGAPMDDRPIYCTLRRVPEKRVSLCHGAMLVGYGNGYDMKQSETRPDAGICMHVNRERRQAWAEQSKLNLDRRGNLKSFHSERVSISLYRETYARPRS